MSESADISASGKPLGKSVRVVAHETAIAPEDTLARLEEVLEASCDPAYFEEAFVEFARGLTGARAAYIFRESESVPRMEVAAVVPGMVMQIADDPALIEQVGAALSAQTIRRATISHGETKYGLLCAWLAGDENGRDSAVLALVLGPDRAPFAGPIFTIEQLLTRIFGERARIEESKNWKEGFLQSTMLVDLFSRAGMAPSMRDAVSMIAGEIREFIGCSRVAIGLGIGQGCQVQGLSGSAKIEDRSHGTRLLRGLMRESLGIGKAILWPSPEAADSPMWPATDQGELLEAYASDQALTIPLRTLDDTEIGSAIFLFDEQEQLTERKWELIDVTGPHIAALLEMVRESKPRGIRGFFHRYYVQASRNRKTAIWASLLIVGALLLVPVPYRVKGNCEVQPVQLRQVAAPFEGRLEDVFVKPGVEVKQDQLLATLDGKELTWRIAKAISEREIALKKRDVAQTEQTDPADAVMAQLEADATGLEVELLKFQRDHLEVRAPSAGFVMSGDLEHSKGVPVSMGQKLFDIAPLERMRIEISVPDSEIRRIELGQKIRIRLEADPRKRYEAVVEEIYPVSEIEDGKNVFITLATLENIGGELRPGMRGKAKIASGVKSLGWILFHKPVDFLRLHL